MIFCVRTVWFRKKSVAVHVIVVTPIGKRLPAGTPERTSELRPMLSVAVAAPIVLSLMNAFALPASVDRVMSDGIVTSAASCRPR